MTKTIHRSAITGQIVTEEFAKQNPDTTVKETILNHNHTDLKTEILAYCKWNDIDMEWALKNVDEYFKGK